MAGTLFFLQRSSAPLAQAIAARHCSVKGLLQLWGGALRNLTASYRKVKCQLCKV